MAARALITLGVLLSAPSAFALTSLKQVQVSNGDRVDLYFDGKIGRSQIKTEYFNDTIQFSITDASVYPAKISSVSSGNIAKIFAYQYAPKLVRCRITVRGKAEAFRDKIEIDDHGKLLTIAFSEATDSRTSHVAEPARHPVEIAEGKAEPLKAKIDKGEPVKIGAGEKSLLDRIMKDSPASAPVKVDAVVAAAPRALEASAPILARAELGAPTLTNAPLAGGKPLASPLHALGRLAIVLGLFGLVALGLRKFLRGEGGMAANRHGSFGAIRRFAANRLGKPAKMIEIVSTHHLGPKKSIVVANIAGRTLVLGITNESINLITQIHDAPTGLESADDASLSVALGEELGPSFAGLLASEDTKSTPIPYGRAAAAMAPAPRAPANMAAVMAASAYQAPGPVIARASVMPAAAASAAGPNQIIRNQIRNRLEGFKPL